jgi:hypothetical protein
MKKAYIGAIGDDFPALFPLILGLMLFFASVSLAYNTYNEKRDLAVSMRANVMLARAVRQRTLMGEEYWDSYACPVMEKMRANYGVGAAMKVFRQNYTTYDLTPGAFSDPNLTVEPIVFQPGAVPSVNATCPEGDWEKIVPTRETAYRKSLIIMVYPVLINETKSGETFSRPGGLMVATWT